MLASECNVICLKASPVSIETSMMGRMARTVVRRETQGFMFLHETLFFGEQSVSLSFKFLVAIWGHGL
jgi:hypothetical protein